jgi:three-Cys-motif partner protein
VIFNLDQCGHSHVERNTILDIMHSYPAAEIFYTFVISSLLAFLQKDQPERLRAQLDHLGLASGDVQALDGLMSQKDWLGTAEKIVFDAFRLCAPYVSPFSINNPGGWRYWLIHFANAYRARQVYNNILHDNASLQAHFADRASTCCPMTRAMMRGCSISSMTMAVPRPRPSFLMTSPVS